MFSKSFLQRRMVVILTRHLSKLSRKNYAVLRYDHVQHFEKLLGASSAVLSSLNKNEDLIAYNFDWLKQYEGHSQLILKPKTTEEVAEIVSYCYNNNLALCVQAGNTGLVGGSVPVFDEIVLNTSRMNQIYDFDNISGILTCQAGCVLETLDNYVGQHGYMMPFDLGAKGSCQIGGNISTSAGGIRFVRYGPLHGYVLGLEVVVPQNGSNVMNMMSCIKKDNTGFHLPHLFIGAEGQLGVVTKVSMVCVPKSTSVNVAFLGLNTFQNCLDTLSLARKCLGEILSSFEFMDHAAVECCEQNAQITTPLETKHNFYLLVETMGSNETHDKEKLESFLESCLHKKYVENGCMASDESQSKKIWKLRENFTEALTKDGHVYKCDISLPLKHFYEIVEETRKVAGDLARRVISYGHLGDGNNHLNITSSQYSEQLYRKLFPFIYDWTWKKGGSISAEHGLGLAKRNYLKYAKRPEVVQTFRQLKQLFDPKSILNPYKYLPDDDT